MSAAQQEPLYNLEELRKTSKTKFLAMVAVLGALASVDHLPEVPTGRCGRGDLKRAIRILREFQGTVKHPGEIEHAITLICRDWLHGKEDQ